ncbi:MAG: thermonuclease family protein [Ilumatobacteraceae bacterium]
MVDGDTVVVDVAGRLRPSVSSGSTPRDREARRPRGVFGPEASAATKELLPDGTPVWLVRDVEARDDYGRLLAYVHRATDGTFVNLALVRRGFATVLTFPPNTAHVDDFVAGGRGPPTANSSGCGRRAPDNVSTMSTARALDRRQVAGRTSRPHRRHEAARRLVRRPRLLPRQRRGVRSAPRRGGHLRVADGAGAMGPPRSGRLRRRERRRHRGAPHPQLRARRLPVRADHPRRRCCRARAGSPRRARPVGALRSGRGARECRAQIERARVGHRRHPSRAAPHLDHLAARVLRRVPRARDRVPATHPPPSTISADQAGFPFRRLAAAGRRGVPRPLRPRLARRQPRSVYQAVRDLQPGVTEIHVQPAIDTPEVRALSPQADGWIDDLALVTTDHTLRELLRDSGAVLIGYRALRDAMRAG